MANSYITFTHGGTTKRYVVLQTLWEPSYTRSRSMFVTVGKKTRIQDFGFTDYTWAFNLLMPYQDQTRGGYTYGGWVWLRDTLYEQPTVTFTDHYGVSHTVTFDGKLSPQPLGALVDGAAKFIVEVHLRKHQT